MVDVLDVVLERAQPEVRAHLQRIANAESLAGTERERRSFPLAYQ